jgi:hypothetical protein
MMRAVFALFAALFACLLVSSAQAQVTRTFVSGTGTANSSCSYTAPCRFFTQAIAALPSGGGEVDVLDPGSYGQVTIDRPVSIIGRGWTTITATSSSAAITISLPAGTVSISGVQLDGGGSGQTGISFVGGGIFILLDSVIKSFSGDGVSIMPTQFTDVTLRNVELLKNGGNGLSVSPLTQQVYMSAENVTANNNGASGVYVNITGNFSGMFDHLVASQNNYGFQAAGAADEWTATLVHSVLWSNFSFDFYDTNSLTTSGVQLCDHNKIYNIKITDGNFVQSDGSNNLFLVSGTIGRQDTQ